MQSCAYEFDDIDIVSRLGYLLFGVNPSRKCPLIDILKLIQLGTPLR